MNNIAKLLTIFLITACSTGHIVTTNLHNLASFEDNGQVYILPKTRILVNLTVEKTEFTPGPYYKYAGKYLEIEGAKAVASNYYSIKDVLVTTESIADPDYCYSIRNENFGEVDPILNEFRRKGLILEEGISKTLNHDFEELKLDEGCNYLSIKPFSFQENLAGNAVDYTDHNFLNIPILKRQVLLKTEEQEAEEAANFIFKIRKRRFNLIAGKYGVIPEGIALKASVEELNNLEEEYLSLFVGSKKTVTISRTFTVVPNDNEIMQSFTLFRFSDKTGIHAVGEKEGEAVVLQLADLESNKTLSQLQRIGTAQNYDMLYYRIPDYASAKIFFGSHEILEVEISVFQFGALLPKHISPVKKKLF